MTYTPSTRQIREWCAEAGDMGDWAFDRWRAAEEQRIRADERAKVRKYLQTYACDGLCDLCLAREEILDDLTDLDA